MVKLERIIATVVVASLIAAPVGFSEVVFDSLDHQALAVVPGSEPNWYDHQLLRTQVPIPLTDYELNSGSLIAGGTGALLGAYTANKMLSTNHRNPMNYN